MTTLEATAVELVQTRIRGFRKGTKQPAYTHSLRVFDALRRHGCSRDVCLAGLLHDMVEDGDTSLRALSRFGFSKRTVDLVRLCSHDEKVKGGDQRWLMMIAGLVAANDRDAWTIKVADVTDNVRGSVTMPADRARFMCGVKAPLILQLTAPLLKRTGVWQELRKEIEKKNT